MELSTGVAYTGTRGAISKAPLFQDYALDYIIWYRGQFPASASRTEQIIDTVMPYLKGKRLDQITPIDARDFILSRQKATVQDRTRKVGPATVPKKARTVSSATVTKEYKAIKAMFERAVEWKIIKEHPFKDVNAPPERRSKVPGFYTPAQLIQLYEHSKPQRKGELDYRPVWRFMVNTGLRRGEAVKAHRHDVMNGIDIAPGLPDQPILMVESDPEETGATKSGKLRRIPLNSQAVAALELLGKDRLLPGVCKESLTRAFRRCAKSAGLRGSIHWLRHTFGTSLALEGVAVHVIKELMGHASITTTEQYLQLVQEHLSSAVGRIKL